jgi:hypothetical protein
MRFALRQCRRLFSTARPAGPAGTVGALALAAMLLAPVAAEGPLADEQTPSATVRIEQVQVAFIGSGNLGGGTLNFQGRSYDFTVGGLGIGGFGVSRMVATGEVYDLKDLADFPGAYAQGRYGAAAGTVSAGELWLVNTNGVTLHLKAEREGLAISLGGDAVYIDFDD